jgi:hypothetical protein
MESNVLMLVWVASNGSAIAHDHRPRGRPREVGCLLVLGPSKSSIGHRWCGGLHAEGLAFAERMMEDDRAGKKGRIRVAFATEAIFESLSSELQEVVRERHETFRAAPKVGFLKPKDASDTGGFKAMYVAYSQFSGDAAHPTMTALARHWGPADQKTAYFDAEPEPRKDELDETLHLTCIALISMMVVVNEMVGYTEAGMKLLEINHATPSGNNRFPNHLKT